jgi:hypothetical protein
VGQRGLSQTRRAVQEHVLHRLLAAAGGIDGDPELTDERFLSDIFVKTLGRRA